MQRSIEFVRINKKVLKRRFDKPSFVVQVQDKLQAHDHAGCGYQGLRRYRTAPRD